jgi:predicted TIM-barrel fold metal-dependent hydrolase
MLTSAQTHFSRRQVLQSTAAAAVATALPSIGTAQTPRVPRVDAHLHCFAGPGDARFPYHERAPYRPEEPATPERLLDCMRGAEVDYAIVVHPEPYQDDHRYLEHCLAVGRGKLKGTALVFADRAGSLDKLPELCRKLPIVTVRVHAYAADRLPPFGKPELRKLWQAAGDNGLAVQLHFQPKYAAGFEPLIREFAKTKVIIDHVGRMFQGTPAENEVVLRWAKLDNTIMKLSAIPSQSDSPQALGALIRRVTDTWGADRLIYGGGFGPAATGESYRQAFEKTRGYLAHLSAADQAKVLGGNAARLFQFTA